MEKILLGMSGGKDSTWACKLLQEKGYEVEGLLLALHSLAPIKAAEESAKRLGIKLHVVDKSEAFQKNVKNYFAQEYVMGRTPNPCVECNSNIKFKALAEEADKLGIEKISTGHYVRVGKLGDRYSLSQASDAKKDQSYFLWQLSQDVLARFVSPLESTTKEDVVKNVLANELLDEIKESQEICFIPNDDYVSFLKDELNDNDCKRAFDEGDFVTLDGKCVGKHKGYATYTVGQRKGLGIALGRPAFVVAILPDENQVVLGFEENNKCSAFKVSSLNFVSISEFEGTKSLFVRPRYRSPLIPCKVSVEGGLASVTTEAETKLVSPGQSAVFYDSDGNVAFGGKIE